MIGKYRLQNRKKNKTRQTNNFVDWAYMSKVMCFFPAMKESLHTTLVNLCTGGVNSHFQKSNDSAKVNKMLSRYSIFWSRHSSFHNYVEHVLSLHHVKHITHHQTKPISNVLSQITLSKHRLISIGNIFPHRIFQKHAFAVMFYTRLPFNCY